jgi:hypothetical protein
MGHGYFSFPHFGFLQNGENHFQFQIFESSFFSITFRVPQIFLAAPEGSGICLPVILAAFFFRYLSCLLGEGGRLERPPRLFRI